MFYFRIPEEARLCISYEFTGDSFKCFTINDINSCTKKDHYKFVYHRSLLCDYYVTMIIFYSYGFSLMVLVFIFLLNSISFGSFLIHSSSFRHLPTKCWFKLVCKLTAGWQLIVLNWLLFYYPSQLKRKIVAMGSSVGHTCINQPGEIRNIKVRLFP